MPAARNMSIPEFFSGQTLMVTGGTGFVGKVFVEKILRSCPDVERIYLVVRSKKGVSFEDRWREISNVPLFDTLRKQNPNAFDKVTLIGGDLKDKNLGISEENWKILLERVTLVYHIAATVQFNNNVIDTLKENLRSTYDLAQMAMSMKKLKTFIYVSTTYSNFNRPEEEWKEQIYPAVQDWRVLLKLLDNDTEARAVSILKEKLLDGHPNAYTLSKSLSENLLEEYKQFYPIIIVRPSVVSAITKEPLVGWQDGVNGLLSVCVGVALGIVRVFLTSLDDHQDFIPVDLVANTLAVVAWKANTQNMKSGLEVYNCTMADLNTIPIRTLIDFLDSEYRIHSKNAIWKHGFHPATNYWEFYILFMLRMVIPFAIVDAGLRLAGKKPRLLTFAIKLMVASSMLKTMVLRKIKFPNEKYLALQSLLRKDDATVFDAQPPKLNQLKEIRNSFRAVLLYMLHEDLSEKNLKKNAERFKRLVLIDKAVKVVFYSLIVWLLVQWLNIPTLLSQYTGLAFTSNDI